MKMSLQRRVLLGCGLVAVVLLLADVILASTFRGFLLDRVDHQLTTATEPVASGYRTFPAGDPFPGRPAYPRRAGDGKRGFTPPQATPAPSADDSGFFSEYFVGFYDADGTLS